MAVSDAHVFPGFLTPVLTQLLFQQPPTTFLTCICRAERRKYARKRVRLSQGSNSQPPGYESDMLTTEPPGLGQQAWPGCGSKQQPPLLKSCTPSTGLWSLAIISERVCR